MYTCNDVEEKTVLWNLLAIIQGMIAKNKLVIVVHEWEDKEKVDKEDDVIVGEHVKAVTNGEVLTGAKLIKTTAMEAKKKDIKEDQTSKTSLK